MDTPSYVDSELTHQWKEFYPSEINISWLGKTMTKRKIGISILVFNRKKC